MANSLPYYPLYVYDFDEDPNVLAMNLTEVGLYQLALNEAWKRGSIPDDPTALANLIRRKPAEVKRAWLKVRTCWIESSTPGKLVNPRLEKERDKVNQRQEQASDAGKSSASIRKQSKAIQRTLVPYAYDSGSISDSGLESENKLKPSTRAHSIDAADQMRMWCNHRGFKKPSRGQRTRVIERMEQISITESENERSLDGYYASDWGRENGYPIWGYLKNPHSWIADDEDEVAPVVVRSSVHAGAATAVEAQDAQETELPALPVRWNGTATAADPVVVWPPVGKDRISYETAIANPQFNANIDKWLLKCQDLSSKGGEKASCLNFFWACANWQKILNGGCNWMVAKFEDSPKRFTVEEQNQRVLEQAQAERAARREAANAGR